MMQFMQDGNCVATEAKCPYMCNFGLIRNTVVSVVIPTPCAF